MTNHIHPTALIAEGVPLGENNTLGPFVVIDPYWSLGHDRG